jgi:hypothetical protein
MSEKNNSILVIGFNSRPLVYSLYQAGYSVYAVDFFGDLDLYPYVKDCIILIDELKKNYEKMKENYKTYLSEFAIKLLKKYPHIKYLLIGSGLDDAFNERKMILNQIKKISPILDLNNDIQTIQKARDISKIYQYLTQEEISAPLTFKLSEINSKNFPLDYPFILKKLTSSGGTNVYKIKNEDDFNSYIKLIREKSEEKEWIIQEFIEGNPVSCTIISNGSKAEVISVNHQIIGMDKLNPPREFMYCGNIVPAKLMKAEEKKVVNISLKLTKSLKLKGINGFDFVIRDHQAYLMEINPRIPGSIRASEESLGLNLLKLHVKSFHFDDWEQIKKVLQSSKQNINGYCTKLIYFAPKDLEIEKIIEINKISFIHDKSKPDKKLKKGEPVCTILYQDETYSASFSGSLKIVDKLSEIIK